MILKILWIFKEFIEWWIVMDSRVFGINRNLSRNLLTNLKILTLIKKRQTNRRLSPELVVEDEQTTYSSFSLINQGYFLIYECYILMLLWFLCLLFLFAIFINILGFLIWTLLNISIFIDAAFGMLDRNWSCIYAA